MPSDKPADTISMLFARDPLHYQDGDIEAIIEAQREARRLYKQSGKPVSKQKHSADLGDLGLV